MPQRPSVNEAGAALKSAAEPRCAADGGALDNRADSLNRFIVLMGHASARDSEASVPTKRCRPQLTLKSFTLNTILAAAARALLGPYHRHFFVLTSHS
jgi:hypothetical protein